VRHFRFEEDFVFPVIRERLATPANLELMVLLKADHTEILSLLRDFTRHVADSTIPLDEKNTAQASRIGEKIIARMQQHAVREDDRLIPLIRMNLPLFRAQVEEK
jgi:iron-sulfur cluster repair protein YtfE (RIC family)